MQSSSPLQYPSTPTSLRYPLQFRPLNSSPLADSPGRSSPVLAAQARRKSQYKGHSPTTPVSTRSVSGSRQVNARLFSGGSNVANYASSENDSQKVSLRDRFKARCLERAVKARQKAIRGKRSTALQEPSSDDFPMEGDDSEDDEDIMQDELFRRIMANANRKEQHAYRVSYAYEVGSSFDPDMEDPDTWEQELTAPSAVNPQEGPSASTSTISSSSTSPPFEEEELTPVDLEDEELQAYAEEYARIAALEEFEDIPDEDLFYWNDLEELESSQNLQSKPEVVDAEMDMS